MVAVFAGFAVQISAHFFKPLLSRRRVGVLSGGRERGAGYSVQNMHLTWAYGHGQAYGHGTYIMVLYYLV